MKKYKLLSLLVVLVLQLSVNSAWSGALDPFAGQKGTLKIAGGTAHIPVIKEAAKLIMTANPDIRITIAGGGSGVGIKQVGESIIDIGNSGRKPTEQEIGTYNLHPVKWGIDGVGVVVNPDNPVTALSTQQLQGIFAGTITSWKELGGKDRSINIYDRDAASGTRSVFWKKGLKKSEVSKKANVVVSNGAMKTAIANDPYGIGFVSVGHIDASVAPVSLDGVAPTLDNVKSGKYPVARGLYSCTKGEPSGLAALLFDFLHSPEGRKIVEEKGFISVE
ncbi:phosphate ABC transporter substrate-binding protein [Desulforhopalus singaporensis]|uniref:Phosphate ABC transporter substrate-binding protein, PhoT family n=1 Tax=Desulforhopalus singaporensis TaxID=91360 RepID=A0A1H0URD5_9BACT|nr:phosphate ABC transporter substrate-binding protein [Desulforhopalus singaporensis]SDP68724.1 phosphate ABC transporter substrate-binding protein, PhoT family [Desulforhopalus singaporensis]